MVSLGRVVFVLLLMSFLYNMLFPFASRCKGGNSTKRKDLENELPGHETVTVLNKDFCHWTGPPGNQGKTAVALSFAGNQVAQAERALQRFEQIEPCLGLEGVQEKAVLIVYGDLPLEPGALPRQRLEELVRSLPVISKCFKHVVYTSANLTKEDDIYDKGRQNHLWTRGPNALFFNLLLIHLADVPLKDLNIEHLYWMEPDVEPLQKGWLDRLMMEGQRPDGYWISGSAFRGKCLPQEDGTCRETGQDNMLHINGNALYHVGDKRLLDYLTEINTGALQDWPCDLTPFLHMNKLWPDYKIRDHRHLLRHADWVRNYGSYPFDKSRLPPSVFLLHYSKPKIDHEVPDEQVWLAIHEERELEERKHKAEAGKYEAARLQELKEKMDELNRQVVELEAEDAEERQVRPGELRSGHDPNLLARLKKIATPDKQIMLVLATGNDTARYGGLLENFISLADEAGLGKHTLLVAVDKQVIRVARDLEDSGLVGAALDFSWSDPPREIRTLRWQMVRECLAAGYSVLSSSLDVAWLKPPWGYFTPEADFQLGSESQTGFRQDVYGGHYDMFVGTSVFVATAMQRTLRLVEAVEKALLKDSDLEDSDVLNELFSTPSRSTRHLIWRVLEPSLFPNGPLYFEQGLPQSLGVAPLAVANTWATSRAAQILRFREAAMWTPDDDLLANTASVEHPLEGGRQYLFYVDGAQQNGLDRQRSSLKDALAIAEALQRVLILPEFHSRYATESPVTFDYFFDYEQLLAQFSNVVPHRFLEELFPHWNQFPIHFISTKHEPQPYSGVPWGDRIRTLRVEGGKGGASEKEIKDWFGNNKAQLLVLGPTFERFEGFSRLKQQQKFEQRVSVSLAPQPQTAELINHVHHLLLQEKAQYNCLHLQRGKDFLEAHSDLDHELSRVAELAASHLELEATLYVATNDPSRAVKSAFTAAGFASVKFLEDHYPAWTRSHTRHLDGSYNMRWGQIDQGVCARAKKFVGHSRSTFSQHIADLRRQSNYQQTYTDLYNDADSNVKGVT